MSEAAANETLALAYRAQSLRERAAQDIRRAVRALGRQDQYRRLFCEPDGSLKADAVAVLTDLARQANFGAIDPRASDADLRANEGARRMLLHIYGRLDLGSTRLVDLARRMKERDE